MGPEDLHEVAGATLSNVMQVPIRNRAAQVYLLPPTKDAEPVPQMTVLLVLLGDVERGRKVFTEATCSECHVVAGDGTEYGPDLSTIGSKLGLYEAVLDSSASISPSYTPYLFELANGESVVGMLVSETDDRVTVRTEGGVVTEYERAEMESVVPQSVSIMPPVSRPRCGRRAHRPGRVPDDGSLEVGTLEENLVALVLPC